MINYPKEFIEKCKEIYPDYERLHELLDEGNVFVGRYLDDGSYGSISAIDVLKAVNLEELKEKAILIQEKRKLYGEWTEIYQEQIKINNCP